MRVRNFAFLVTITLIALVACAPVTPASDRSDSPAVVPAESGIEGHVLIGPTCPVSRSGEGCEDQPYQARITVLDEGGQTVNSLLTEADGHFKLVLEPGTYVLRPENLDSTAAEGESGAFSLPRSQQYPFAEEQKVIVMEGQFTPVDIVFDSGIR